VADDCRHHARHPETSLDALTRAHVVDTEALRRRVLADELGLAADVFDVEPLPLNDPLLGRSNVVHTPHNAGRTIDANRRWAEMLAEQFDPGSRVSK
jgi:phosphoglycerate dehydrogenase-like enzyme